MVIVKLMGGLGNQMFQYATGRSLAIHTNKKLVLYIGGYEFNRDATPRKFKLNMFQIKAEIPSPFLIKIKYKKYFETTIIKRIKRKLKLKNRTIVYNDESHQFISDLFLNKKNIYLSGDFQSEKYFKNIRNILLEDFLPQENIDIKYKKILTNVYESNSVSIHIRRGDYVKNPSINQYHGLCSLNYYAEAIKHITKSISNPSFFIFSDDIEWVKHNLPISEQSQYVSDINIFQDYEEMYIMSKCKHNIIANSSFSWWAAWLNQNSKKIVIAPKKWFTDESLIADDLIPANWIKL